MAKIKEGYRGYYPIQSPPPPMTKKLRTVKMPSPDGLLTIRIKHYKDGEWVGQCDEISGFLTGGKNSTNKEIYQMIYDCTVALFQ